METELRLRFIECRSGINDPYAFRAGNACLKRRRHVGLNAQLLSNLSGESGRDEVASLNKEGLSADAGSQHVAV